MNFFPVQPSDTLLVEMNDQVNLTCSTDDNFDPIEACFWINTKLDAQEIYKSYKKYKNYDGYTDYTYDEYLEVANLQKKFPCLPGLKVSDNMICGGNFDFPNNFGNNPINCNLTIQEVNGFKHEGNWTCQLKINSNWINSTNYLVVKDVTNSDDMISMYMSKLVKQITASVDTFLSMIEEFDIM